MIAPTISLPSTVLRSSASELIGSGTNSIPLPRLVKAVEELLPAAVPGGLGIAMRAIPLAQVAAHWSDLDNTTRTVFTTGQRLG